MNHVSQTPRSMASVLPRLLVTHHLPHRSTKRFPLAMNSNVLNSWGILIKRKNPFSSVANARSTLLCVRVSRAGWREGPHPSRIPQHYEIWPHSRRSSGNLPPLMTGSRVMRCQVQTWFGFSLKSLVGRLRQEVKFGQSSMEVNHRVTSGYDSLFLEHVRPTYTLVLLGKLQM